ncbi:MAG: MATE family efflux transporter [Vigna little leaf phytoplasma]|nr:MATE family efflux transporter [Vigna little leaf phytoplasma]
MHKLIKSDIQNSKREMIIKGNLFKVIIIFILPIALANIVFNVLPKQIDLIFINCQKENHCKLDNFFLIDSFVKLINYFGNAIAIAGTILIGHELGKNNIQKANNFVKTTIITVISVSFLIVMFFFIIGIFIKNYLNNNSILNSRDLEDLYFYYVISLISGFFISINTVFFGLIRIDKKLKVIYLFNLFFLIMKFCLNYIFFNILNKNGKIYYIGISSLLANFTLFLLIFLFFSIDKKLKLKGLKRHFKNFFLDKNLDFKTLFKMFIPLLLGKIIPESGRVCLLRCIKQNGFYPVGTLTMISYTDLIVGLGLQFCFALEEGQILIISANLGNRNVQRALRTIWLTLIINFILGFFFSILLYSYGFYILNFLQTLTNPNNKLNSSNFDILQFKTLILYACLSGFFTVVTQGILLKSMIAFKKPLVDIYFGFIRVFILRIPLILIFRKASFSPYSKSETWYGFGVANLLTNLIILFFIIIYFYFKFYKKLKKNQFKI